MKSGSAQGPLFLLFQYDFIHIGGFPVVLREEGILVQQDVYLVRESRPLEEEHTSDGGGIERYVKFSAPEKTPDGVSPGSRGIVPGPEDALGVEARAQFEVSDEQIHDLFH